MNRRSVLLLVATVVALLGTLLVFLYVRGADNRASAQFDTVKVLRAVEVIEAGESIETASGAGKLALQDVPQNQLLPGALTDTKSLAGQVATTRIFPGEQIIADKFGGQAESASLAIPEGMQAISVTLTDPARVAGFVNPGSEIAIYHIQQPNAGFQANDAGTGPQPSDKVLLLLQRVQVLGVGSTSTTTKVTTNPDGTQTTEDLPRTLITLAVTQLDAQRILWAENHGELSLALLTKDSKIGYGNGAELANVYKHKPRA